jgi:hypothetical protein
MEAGLNLSKLQRKGAIAATYVCNLNGTGEVAFKHPDHFVGLSSACHSR